MAQVLKLKRTAVNGKTPTTSNLELGEMAMNTFDGRIFLKKDSGTPVVNEILTTNTEGSITGSLNLNGNITASNLTLSGNAIIDGNITLGGNITIGDNIADVITVTAGFSGSLIPDATAQYDLGSSTKKWNTLHVVTASADFFIGDGSQLTNVNASVSQQASVTSSFTAADEITIVHGFDSRNIHVSVYDSSNQLIIPESVTLTTSNQVDVTLQSGTTGYVVVAKGGHLLSGSQPIAETATVTSSFDAQSTVTVAHNFDSKNVMVTVYDSSDNQIIPDSVSLLDNNSVKVDFVSSQSGFIVVAKGGHVVQGTSSDATNLNGQPASYYLNYNNFTNIPIGLVSGSSQLTSSYDTRYALSGSSGTSDFTQLTNIPSGLVSSSQQITNGSGLFSGSFNNIPQNPFVSASNAISASGHFVPDANEAYDLGSPTQRWRDLYLSGSTLFLGETKITRTQTGDVEFRDSESDVLRKIRVDELEIGSGVNSRRIQVDNTGRIKFSDTDNADKTLDSFGFQNVITSSAQLSFDEIPGIPSGLISSSFQVNLQETTNFVEGIKTRLNNEAVLSGSSQISFNGIVDKPTLVSGSLQISYSGLSNIPNGIVSGSSQISLSGFSTTNLSEGTNLYYTDVRVKTKLNTEGVISGSSQVDYNSIQNKPTIPSSITDLNISDGTNGQVLTTNGSGTFSFQTPSSGSGDTGDITFLNSTIDTDNSSDIIITPSVTMSADLKVEGTLEVDSFVSRGIGSAKIEAGANLELTAGNAVVIISSPLRLASFTTTERNALAAQNGDLIYNTTLNKLQGFQSGSWINIDGS